MNELRDQSVQFASQHMDDFLTDLCELLKLPSISTSPEHAASVHEAAESLSNLLTRMGMEHAAVMPTALHPVVYADWLHAGPEAQTVLVYGHYDVQPVDPIELWDSGPFDPTLQGDYLYARGASDMKGQVIASLSAIRSIVQTGQFPVNLKFLLEGEEEIGSPSLRQFLEEHRELFKCDFALNPDSGMISPDLPTVVYSLRGLSFFELKVISAERDLHSGVFGGVVHNPAVAISELIAGMHDQNGTITLPGFYDSVHQVSAEEHQQLAKLPMDEGYFLAQTGASQLWGEKDFLPVERVGVRPTLEINGLISGYTGPGTKTVLPSFALAKISCRLVANQDPEEVYRQMLAYLKAHAPATIRCELTYLGGSPASHINPANPNTQALVKALEFVWGNQVAYKCEGGSIPVVGDMQEILGANSVMTGFGLPDDRIHSPNERLHLPTWRKGIIALVHFFFNLVEGPETV